MKRVASIAFLIICLGCREGKKEMLPGNGPVAAGEVQYAKGFSISGGPEGITVIRINSPWPNAQTAFTYALVPRDKLPVITLNTDAYDAIIGVPVERVVVTSTTHIPALEALGVTESLVGFPNCDYISSEETRKRIKAGKVMELGNNESLNTERVVDLQPDVVIGFSIDNRNSAYETIRQSHIPVVYNGDWTEETPLGKAEWIKFFAPFYGLEEKADRLFADIAASYEKARALALNARERPTVLSGSLYRDVWYLPGGASWAARFMEDANAHYLWADTNKNGSLSLSLESVLDVAGNADFWISPSQFTSYGEMEEANKHYLQFRAFSSKRVFTYARTTGATGGLMYFELGPNRPDLILKDLIRIFHPELLPDYEPFFFKPLR